MNNDVFMKIAGAVLTILAAIITAYIIPAIKSHINQKDIDTLMYYLSIAIKCADQIFTREQWEEKKQYVFDYITKVVNENLNINLNEKDINVLIEGMVNEIHDNGVKDGNKNSDK